MITDIRAAFFSIHSPIARAGIVVATSLAVAKLLTRFGGLSAGTILAIVPATFILFWFCQSPRWPIAGFLMATFFGLYRSGGLGLGPLNVRIPDIPYLFMLAWAILLRARDGRDRRWPIGQPYVALFLGVLALSLFPVLVDHPDTAVNGLVGWLRFVQTLSVLWLLPHLLRTPQDRIWLLQLVPFAIAVELLRAFYFYSSNYGRLAGGNGPNAEGLLAAVLIILALQGPAPRSKRVRVLYLLIGVASLILARSIGSMVSLGLVLGVGGLRLAARRFEMRADALIRPLRLLLLLVLAFVGVATLRPGDLPGRDAFNFSSSAYRVVVGYAGIHIWLQHPLLGVGWQQSSQPEVISDPRLVRYLEERFPDVNPAFFPTTQGATVHNAYIQVLAETGIIGGLALLIAFVAVKRTAGTWWRTLTGVDRVTATAAALALIVVLIWWNDNPFYGSQPETVLAATFLGLLASFRITRSPRPLEAARTRAGDAATPALPSPA